MKMTEILIAGFGGQGVLFIGKLLAHTGLMTDKNVSWLPSYGPEMRGGTCNCSVIVGDGQIGSPIVSEPNVLMAMNLPSLEKYENSVTANGLIVYDSYLIQKAPARSDVKVVAVPATQLSKDEDLSGLANMIVLGAMIKASGLFTLEEAEATITKTVSAKKAAMLEKNIKAITLGYNYVK